MLGVLTAQAAWLLAVPAFRGLDEFDHVYRAASVARGEWLPSGVPAAHGRGELVIVPRDIVAAAGPECRARSYTGHDNCAPVADEPGDSVRVATAASRYEPVYYWVVGTAARWAHGTSADYVMRIVSALLCALFTGLAAWAVSRWARTRWPLCAVVGSLTPVVVYSSIVVAPNALEIAAATSTWVALAGLAADGVEPRTERWLLWAAVPGAVLLANLRSLGIGFLGLILLAVVAVLGRRRLRGLVSRQRSTLRATSGVVAVATAAAMWWLVTAAPNRLEEHGNYKGVMANSLIQVPVWMLQTIAAAPGRTDPAPLVVYLLCGGVLATFTVLALRRSDRRIRQVLLAIVVVCLVAPLLLTLHTYRDVGVVWQGRYGIPFGVGILVLAGLALDLRQELRPPSRPVLVAVFAAYVIGQLVAVLHVLAQQRQLSPSVAMGLWTPPSPWLVGLLTVGGWFLVGTSVLRQGVRTRPRTRRDSPPHEARVGTARGAARRWGTWLRSGEWCSPRPARRRGA
jgi:Predicted membrane protein (DUF2142)